MVLESEYEAGDVFNFKIYYRWYGYSSEDFTVKVYSRMDLEVLDERGETNMLHMDGQ